jgi:hypothetical protein
LSGSDPAFAVATVILEQPGITRQRATEAVHFVDDSEPYDIRSADV